MASADRFETKEYKKYKALLRNLNNDILPKVIAETINNVARVAHEESKKNIRSRFTIRNKYTENSVKYWQAKPKTDINRINAISGSISDYMDEQDSGGYRLPKQGGKVPVATLAARGGNPNKVVKKVNRAGNVAPNQFVGVPRGNPARPYGVYQRNRRNKYLVMIRNITRARVLIKGEHWHKNAVEFHYRREVVTAEFIRLAKQYLSTIQK